MIWYHSQNVGVTDFQVSAMFYGGLAEVLSRTVVSLPRISGVWGLMKYNMPRWVEI